MNLGLNRETLASFAGDFNLELNLLGTTESGEGSVTAKLESGEVGCTSGMTLRPSGTKGTAAGAPSQDPGPVVYRSRFGLDLGIDLTWSAPRPPIIPDNLALASFRKNLSQIYLLRFCTPSIRKHLSSTCRELWAEKLFPGPYIACVPAHHTQTS